MRSLKHVLVMASVLAAAAFLPAIASAALPVPSLVLTASRGTITAGSPVTLTVTSELPATPLELSRQFAGESSFTVLRTVTTSDAGTVSWPATPGRNVTYRVSFAGDASWSAAAAEAVVSVRPRIALSVSGGAVYKGIRKVFHVGVSPVHTGGSAEIQVRNKNGSWTKVAAASLGSDSKAAVKWTSDRIGTLRFRAFCAADADHVAGASGSRRVVVMDPNPFHIPTGPAHYIVVKVHSYKLYYHEHGRIVKVFDCVTGKPSTPSPLGHFHIYLKDHMGGPYGAGRMAYDGIYAVHGTSEPWLLRRYPRNYSHGCTRVSNPHILWLYARCPIGTPVWNLP